MPASRPRVTRYGTYYAKNYKTWRELAGEWIGPGDLHLAATVPLLVVVCSVATKPKTGKKLWPRGDVDNHAKGPLDAITKPHYAPKRKRGAEPFDNGYWHDDEQIVTLLSTKRYALPGELSQSIVEIYRVQYP